MQAQKVSRKAASAGFEWDSLDDVWEKVREEVDELRAAYAAAPKAANGKVDAGAAEGDSAAAEQAAASVEDEFGDVLFSLVNVGCRMGIDAENALRATCGKFRRRWSFMEGAAWAQGNGRSARSRRARGPVAAGQGPRARVALRTPAAANPGCASRPPCASTRPPKRIFAGRAMAPGSRKR